MQPQPADSYAAFEEALLALVEEPTEENARRYLAASCSLADASERASASPARLTPRSARARELGRRPTKGSAQ